MPPDDFTHLDVFDSFLAGEPVAGDDGGGVDLLLDQLIRVLQELGGNEDDGGGAVADFLILKLGKLDQNLEKKLFL